MAATAFVMACALSFLGLSVPAQAAPGDNSRALAQFLGSNSALLGTQLLNVGTAQSSSPGGPAAQTNPLNLQALQALGLRLQVIGDGLEVPLITNGSTPGLLTLGQLGAVQNYAASTPAGSIAASGLISNDGTIAVSQNASPTDFGNATINLTSLLGQLGIAGATGPVIDSLGLEVGAVASRIDWTAGGAPVADYRVTDLKANVHSALVAALATNLRAAGVTVGTGASTTLNGLVGTQGLLNQVVNAVPPINLLGLASVSLGRPTIAVNLANLGAVVDTALGTNSILVSDDGSVTINLTTGTVSVNLAKIVNPGGPNLNGLAPNTSVLTSANILTITAGVTNALGKVLAPVTNAVKLALHQSTVTVSLQVTATLLPVLGNTGKLIDAPITISGTLDELATGNGHINTAGLVLLPNVPLCIGVPTGGGGCLGVNLNGLVGALVSAVVAGVVQPLLAVLGPQVTAVLTAGDAQITSGLNAALNPVITGLSPVLDAVLRNVVDVTINEQPRALVPSQNGDLGAGSATVRALSVTLLPRLLGSTVAKVSLGSSTVLAQPAPAVNIVETTVVEGKDIQVAGAGFSPAGPVSVAFTDGDNQPVGAPRIITPDAGGAFAFTRTIPLGTVGPVTATASQGAFSPTDSVVVTAAPTFNILETTVAENGEITAMGSNWTPTVPVTIVLTNTGGTEVGRFTAVPAANGWFNVATPVPAGATGTITATATQAPDTQLTDTVQVVANTPLVNIVQSTAVAGTAVTLEGSEWDPGTVSIEFTDSQGTSLGSPLIVPVGVTGVFNGVQWAVPANAIGVITATASQNTDTARDSVLIFAAPSVNIVEPSVVAGHAVTIEGAGWAPTPLTIGLSDGIGHTDSVSATPLVDGTFSIDYTVPVSWRDELTATVLQDGTTRTDIATIVDPPIVDILQTTIAEGGSIAVNGSGWDDALLVFVNFTDAGGTQIGSVATGVTPQGTFTVPFTVPVGTVGPVTATASEGVNTATDSVAVTLVPTVAIDEATVEAGGTIHIGGTKWAPGAVTLSFTDRNNVSLGSISTLVVDGLIADTFVVPLGTLGPVTVTASQGANTATDTVEVAPEPSLNIVETQVVAGEQIHLSGSNWSAASLVTITFTDVNNATIPGTQLVFPLANGDFTATFTVPVGTRGPVTATASQNGETALDTVDVIPLPVVNIIETSVVAGNTITAEGDDWQPELAVTLVYTDGANAAIGQPIEVITDDAGSFTHTFTVPPGTTGPVRVTVTQTPDTATDTVEVTQDADADVDVAIDADADAAADVDAVDADGVDVAADADAVDAAGVDVAADAAGVDVAADAAGVDIAADIDAVDVAGVDVAADVDAADVAADAAADAVDVAADVDAVDAAGVDVAVDAAAVDVAADVDAVDAAGVDVAVDAAGVDVAADVDAVDAAGVDVAVDAAGVDVAADADSAGADVAADVDAAGVDVAADAAGVDVAADVDAVDVAADAVDVAADVDAVDAAGVDVAVDAAGVDVAVDADAAGADVAADVDAAGVDVAADAAGVDVAADVDAVDAAADAVDVAADVDAVDAAGVDVAVDAAGVDVAADAAGVDVAADVDAADVAADAVDVAADVDAVDAAGVDVAVDAAGVDVAADAAGVDVAADVDAADVAADAVDVAADVDAVDAAGVDVAVDAAGVDVAADTDAVDAAADIDAVDAAGVDVAADAAGVDVAADADAAGADVAADADAAGVDVAADADSGADVGADVGADTDTDAGPISTDSTYATVLLRVIERGRGIVELAYGYGFQPGEVVSATLHSEPVYLGTQIADASGNVSFPFEIGSDFEVGRHHIEFVGALSGELPNQRETTDFVVTAATASALAATGFEATWLAALAALLLLAGAGVIGVTRRRESRARREK